MRTDDDGDLAQRDSPERRPRNGLDAVALGTTLIGAPVAVALMLYIARNNDSRLLLGLFTLWILGPFGILLGTYTFSAPWSRATRTSLRALMVIVPALTIAVYSATVFGPVSGRHASRFVLLPPLSCVLVVCCLSISSVVHRLRTRKRRDQS